MALVNEFVCFNELHNDLKMIIIDNMSSKEFMRFIASGNSHGLPPKDVKRRLKQFQSEGYSKLIGMLYTFTTECLDLENKFMTDENIRTTHFDMFFNGYQPLV